MKLIVGLGNPGRRYNQTRHNLGFQVLDDLADRWNARVSRTKFQGLFGETQVNGEKIVLLKPQTFMNLSGQAVAEAVGFYQTGLDDVLVVLDDMDLPLGCLRIRPGGSAGGHRGLKSVIERLGCRDVPRLRIGIGAVEGEKAIGHVLGRFSEDELPRVRRAVERAADAAEGWARDGLEAAQNRYNRKENES